MKERVCELSIYQLPASFAFLLPVFPFVAFPGLLVYGVPRPPVEVAAATGCVLS